MRPLTTHAASVVDDDDQAAQKLEAGVVAHPHLVVDKDLVGTEAALHSVHLIHWWTLSSALKRALTKCLHRTLPIESPFRALNETT